MLEALSPSEIDRLKEIEQQIASYRWLGINEAIVEAKTGIREEALLAADDVLRLLPALLSERERYQEEIARLKGLPPDHCYDPDDGDVAYGWSDRDEILEHGDYVGINEMKRVKTFIDGPDWWVARVLAHPDDDDPETLWFKSEAEAKAAIDASDARVNSPAPQPGEGI